MPAPGCGHSASDMMIGQYKMQTVADYRLQIGYKMQTADYRLGTKCRLGPIRFLGL